MNKRGFTLIELAVVLAIIVILAALIVPALISSGKVIRAEVTDKWTDVDQDNIKIYRIRTTSPSGEIETYNSYFCHDQIQIGNTYEFQLSYNTSYVSKPKLIQKPVESSHEN